MYNAEFKNRYISEAEIKNTNINRYLTTQFRKSETVETANGKDLYDFTVSEAVDYYKTLCLTSLETLMVLNNQFALYTRYALSNNVVKDSQNHFEEIDNDVLITCVNRGLAGKKIFTREELQERVIRYTQNACETYLIYAFFEGICGEHFADIANLTKENFKGGKAYLPSGKVLEVSAELLEAMEASADEYVYYGYTKRGMKEFKYKDGDPKIIKEMYNTYRSSKDRDRSRVYNRIYKMASVYDLPGLSAKTLMESGRIDMINGYMKDEDISAKQAIIDHREELEYRYGKISSIPRYILKYNEYFYKK